MNYSCVCTLFHIPTGLFFYFTVSRLYVLKILYVELVRYVKWDVWSPNSLWQERIPLRKASRKSICQCINKYFGLYWHLFYKLMTPPLYWKKIDLIWNRVKHMRVSENFYFFKSKSLSKVSHINVPLYDVY